MLGDDDHQDIHAVAEKADKLWALHGHRQHGSIAAVAASAEPVAQVAAVRGSAANRGNNKRGRGASGRGATGASRPPRQQASTSGPAAVAQQAAGLCFYHWRFGEHATKCEEPCTWQGN